MLTLDTRAQVRHAVRNWLESIGVSKPPVPVYEIAARLGYATHTVTAALGPLAERRTLGGQEQILLNVSAQGDLVTHHRRLRFALAHEIMALQFPEIGEGLGEGAERVYQQCASELLLYRPWLEDCAGRREWDLPGIVREVDASWEATARAMLDLDECVLTILDDRHAIARIGSEGLRYPRSLMDCEQEALRGVYEDWEEQVVENGLMRVRIWPVDPPGAVRRVIAFTWGREG